MFEDKARDQAMKDLARISTNLLNERGFVLSGGSSLKILGLTNRMSEDIDLFTTRTSLGIKDGVTLDELESISEIFSMYAKSLVIHLKNYGYKAKILDSADFHLKIGTLKDGYEINCDLSIQDRTKDEVIIDNIHVNDKYDAERGKFSALFDRARERDFYDSYQIALKEDLSCVDALKMSKHDLDKKRVSEVSEILEVLNYDVFIKSYGMTIDEIENMRTFLRDWFEIGLKELDDIQLD